MIVFGMSVLLCNMAIAKDCKRPIKQIRQGAHSANLVYVIHGDGYGNSGMQLANINNDKGIMNRTLSMLLTALLAKKSITFSYIDVNGVTATCTPTSTQQFIGVIIE